MHKFIRHWRFSFHKSRENERYGINEANVEKASSTKDLDKQHHSTNGFGELRKLPSSSMSHDQRTTVRQPDPAPVLHGLPNYDYLDPTASPDLSIQKEPENSPHRMDQMSWNRKQDLSRAQEELQDSREEVLGERFSLRAQRSKLSELRQKTGAAEGTLLSYIRGIYMDSVLSLSDDFEEMLQNLSNLRDQLGNAEVEYEQAEQRYNGLEWSYTEKEEAFIEGLKGGDNNHQHLSETVADDIRDLTRFSSEPFGRSDPSYQQEELISDKELPEEPSNFDLERSDDIYAPAEIATGMPLTINNDGATIPFSAAFDATLQSLDGTKSFSWLQTLNHINSWLLGVLICSPLQESRIRYGLNNGQLDGPDWWMHVVGHWNSDGFLDFGPREYSSHIGLSSTGPPSLGGSVQRNQDVTPEILGRTSSAEISDYETPSEEAKVYVQTSAEVSLAHLVQRQPSKTVPPLTPPTMSPNGKAAN